MLLRLLGLSSLALLVIATDADTSPASGSTTCKNPQIRKEWRTFSTQEKANWISAVKCLSHLPHTNALTPTVDPAISQIPPVNTSGSYYDDFVYMHMDLNIKIHFTGLFLPWHRWYVYVYGLALSQKCGYKGKLPYWNWTQDAADFYHNTLFQESSTTSGIGGWGVPSKDYSVPDGGFHDLRLAYPVTHTLRRNYTLQPWIGITFPGITDDHIEVNTTFTQAEVDKLTNGYRGDFKGFQTEFEKGPGAHGSVHLIVGGDMGGHCPINAPATCTPGPTWSANEPLFWMHHAMVDKVWYDWQHKHPENFWSYEGGSVQNLTNYPQYSNGAPPALTLNSLMPNDNLFPAAHVRDVFNTTSGILCYKYE